MNACIEVQVAEAADIDRASLPSGNRLRAWAEAALRAGGGAGSLCVRVVGEAEGQSLNAQFRGKRQATNVLAFPVDGSFEPEVGILGDIAICAPVVCREACEGEARLRHWAHMVVHGVLHLLGHDHQTDSEAARMESCEQTILAELGFAKLVNPKEDADGAAVG